MITVLKYWKLNISFRAAILGLQYLRHFLHFLHNDLYKIQISGIFCLYNFSFEKIEISSITRIFQAFCFKHYNYSALSILSNYFRYFKWSCLVSILIWTRLLMWFWYLISPKKNAGALLKKIKGGGGVFK